MVAKQEPALSKIASVDAIARRMEAENLDPRVGMLVEDLTGRVADKWTMLVLETLQEKGKLRFTRISKSIPGVSQKMLTQTLRGMERDGLLKRAVHPVIPPKFEYRLTDLGSSLNEASCGVWVWAEKHLDRVEETRTHFDKEKI